MGGGEVPMQYPFTYVGRIDPGSIIGQMVADDMKKERAIGGLPRELQDAVIHEAILAMHESTGPCVSNEARLEGRPQEARKYSLDALLPGKKPGQQLVIRDDDLKLLDAICAGVMAAAGAGYFINPATANAVVVALTGLIVSAFKILRQLDRKSATIDHGQIQLILALINGGAMTVPEMCSWLQKTMKKGQASWSEDEVRKQLKALERTRLRDGTVIALVQEAGDGKWSAAGI